MLVYTDHESWLVSFIILVFYFELCANLMDKIEFLWHLFKEKRKRGSGRDDNKRIYVLL